MHRARLLIALVTLLVAGCGGTRFMAPAPLVTAPPAGKALVNFHRPSNWGGNADFPIYDRTTLVGNLKGKTVVQLACDPGEHWFIGRADHVTVIKATLEAGQTYDIAVDIGMGMMQANITISPLRPGDARRADLPKWERIEKPMAMTGGDDAEKFQERHRQDLEEILADFQGPKKDRVQVMAAGDHR